MASLPIYRRTNNGMYNISAVIIIVFLLLPTVKRTLSSALIGTDRSNLPNINKLECAERDKDPDDGSMASENGIDEPDPNSEVLLQLGYMYLLRNDENLITDRDRAKGYIDRALQIDPSNPHAWYALGRYYMQLRDYKEAYESFQQAVHHESLCPHFWSSIGILHSEMKQYREALDAYTRALRINPYIPEIWFNLGTLYESCDNPIQDAIDAYGRAYELDNNCHLAEQRLKYLKGVLETGNKDNGPPFQPVHIDPQQYQQLAKTQILENPV